MSKSKKVAVLSRFLRLSSLIILLTLAVGLSWPQAARAGWVQNPYDLNYARVHHSATILANGQVLVVGGDDNGSPATVLDKVELYDPASGKWSLTGNLNAAREYHTATLLPNGQVLVAGGANSGGVRHGGILLIRAWGLGARSRP